jgi:hypothetical protein
MSDAGSLSPAEARGLWCRRAVAQGALAVFFVGSVAAFWTVPYEDQAAWLVGAVPAAVLCLILHGRGVRCPRCRNSVFGRRDVDENTYHPGDPGFGPALPDRCRTCQVRLTPPGPAAGEAESNPAGASGRAEPHAAPDRGPGGE